VKNTREAHKSCSWWTAKIDLASIGPRFGFRYGRNVEGSFELRHAEELGEALDSESFWKPHRSFLVNIHHIKELCRGSIPHTC